jgi:hypothetical protein
MFVQCMGKCVLPTAWISENGPRRFRKSGLDSSGDLSCSMANRFDVVAVWIEDVSAVVA